MGGSHGALLHVRRVKNGTLSKTPADLTSHDCIIGPRAFSRASWTFRKGDTVISVDVTGRIRTDSGPGVFTSVMEGLGVAMVSSAMCTPEVRAKKLRPQYCEIA